IQNILQNLFHLKKGLLIQSMAIQILLIDWASQFSMYLHLHLHLVIYQTLLSKATYKGENNQAKSNKKAWCNNKYYFTQEIEKRHREEKEVQECNCCKCKLSTSQGASSEARSSLKRLLTSHLLQCLFPFCPFSLFSFLHPSLSHPSLSISSSPPFPPRFWVTCC